jgi:hypothetical protein
MFALIPSLRCPNSLIMRTVVELLGRLARRSRLRGDPDLSGKTRNFIFRVELSFDEFFWPEPNMVDDVPLRTAASTVWSLYLVKHRDVDAADKRRCLLERHLQGRWEARVSDAEDLTGCGLAYLERLPEDEC